MPEQNYIRLFGPEYFLYIAILLVFAVCLFAFRTKIPKHRKAITIGILLVSLFQQVLLYSSYFYLLDFHLGESLPFHISRISSLLGILLLLTNNRKTFAVLSFFSLYAWATFLYPSRVYAITHPIGLSFIINHVITILLPYYMMIAYGLQIKKGDRNTAFGWFTTYLAFVYFFNPLVDGNYFYLKYRPVFAHWPDYVYLPAALAVTYLGFWLGERWYLFIQQKLSYRRYRTGTHRHKDRGMK